MSHSFNKIQTQNLLIPTKRKVLAVRPIQLGFQKGSELGSHHYHHSPHGVPPLKNEILPLKSKAPFQEMIPTYNVSF